MKYEGNLLICRLAGSQFYLMPPNSEYRLHTLPAMNRTAIQLEYVLV